MSTLGLSGGGLIWHVGNPKSNPSTAGAGKQIKNLYSTGTNG